MELYDKEPYADHWWKANEDFIKIDTLMRDIRLFNLIRQDEFVLEEAKKFLEGNLTNGTTFFHLPAKTKDKWAAYSQFCMWYSSTLYDIEFFNNTIYNFINLYLSKLENLNSNSYAEALHDFLNHPFAEKLIANPLRGTGLFLSADPVNLMYIPRETEKGSGKYDIYEFYEAKLLQTLLKTDFYKALQAGYVIRKCEFCGKFFLLKKGYHTKYCDQPNPKQPEYTCAQLGYHYNGIKEAVADNPKAQSLRRCIARIEKDYSRGIISAEEKEQLFKKARDLFHAARTKAGVSNDVFEQSLATKNLYPLCGVERETKPRGRPKSSK